MTKQEAINDLKMSLRMWGRNPQKESYEIAVAALEKTDAEKVLLQQAYTSKGFRQRKRNGMCFYL